MSLFVKEFWRTYASVASLLLSATHFEDLPRLEYLLEEDEDVIGFGPFRDMQLQEDPSNSDPGSRKPKCHEQGVRRYHPNIEMCCRVRDFVENALKLAHNDVGIRHPSFPNQNTDTAASTFLFDSNRMPGALSSTKI